MTHHSPSFEKYNILRGSTGTLRELLGNLVAKEVPLCGAHSSGIDDDGLRGGIVRYVVHDGVGEPVDLLVVDWYWLALSSCLPRGLSY